MSRQGRYSGLAANDEPITSAEYNPKSCRLDIVILESQRRALSVVWSDTQLEEGAGQCRSGGGEILCHPLAALVCQA